MQIVAISTAVQYFLSRIFQQTDLEEKVSSKERISLPIELYIFNILIQISGILL